MIDLSRVMYNPKISQDFVVNRKVGDWQNGRFVETGNYNLTLTGIITPASGEEIMQQPEGDRATGMMKFKSDQQMYVTHNKDNKGDSGTSDEITWNGTPYRVLSVDPWGDYGIWVAFGVAMTL